MKRILYFLLMALVALPLSAQAPQSFKYQAALRDAEGAPLVSKSVSLRISIVAGTAAGSAVYTETHAAATDAYGMVNLEIGKGAPQAGTFSAIDWSAGDYFVKVELDPAGGSSYTLLGASQLLSVPYALYAEKAGNVPDLSEYPTWEEITPEGTPKLRVSEQGDTLSLGKDNYVFIKGISRYHYGIGRLELLEYGITNVTRNADSDVEITFAYKVKSPSKPHFTNSSNNYGELFSDNAEYVIYQSQENDFIQVGDRTWQTTLVCSYRNSRYLPAGTYHVSGLDIQTYSPSCTTYIAPCEVIIPGGEITPPQPVITDVWIDYQPHYAGGGLLTVTTEGIDIDYTTYTQTVPGGSPENKQHPGIVGFTMHDFLIGTVFSNFRVTDIFGQTSDVWNGTVTYTLSSECDMLRFAAGGQEWDINGVNINTTFPKGTSLYLSPEITISENATITPEPYAMQDFSFPVNYTVTAQDGTQKVYTVKAEIVGGNQSFEILQVKSVTRNTQEIKIILTYRASFIPQEFESFFFTVDGIHHSFIPMFGPPTNVGDYWEGDVAFTLSWGTIPEGVYDISNLCARMSGGISVCHNGNVQVTIPTDPRPVIQEVTVKNVTRNQNQVTVVLSYTAKSPVVLDNANCGGLQATESYGWPNIDFGIPVNNGDGSWSGEVTFTFGDVPAGNYYLTGFTLTNENGDSGTWQNIIVTVP